jgi:hypothetical protein
MEFFLRVRLLLLSNTKNKKKGAIYYDEITNYATFMVLGRSFTGSIKNYKKI